MDVLGSFLTLFVIWVLAAVFVFAAGFVALAILVSIWRIIYALIRPVYEKWCDWVSDALG